MAVPASRQQKPPPRLGSFTVFSGAWATFALELFDDSKAMCAASANCSAAARLRNMVVLAIESPSYMLSWQPPAIEPTVVASTRLPDAGMAPFQLPYPTSAHFDAARGMPPAPSLARRKALAALVANAVRHDANASSSSVDGTNAPWAIGRGPLRALLHAECARAGSSQCLARGGKRGGSFIWNTNNETFAAYQSAVFCLQPWGDSATRKGFWDALLAGCINVIFDDAGWNETDAWFGDHRHWTVRVPLAELGNESVAARSATCARCRAPGWSGCTRPSAPCVGAYSTPSTAARRVAMAWTSSCGGWRAL